LVRVAVDARCKSGLLDDAAAGVAREGRSGDIPLPRLPVPLLMLARRPRAPGLLVLQGVVARSLPEALEEPLLLRSLGGVRAWNREIRRIEDYDCSRIYDRFHEVRSARIRQASSCSNERRFTDFSF